MKTQNVAPWNKLVQSDKHLHVNVTSCPAIRGVSFHLHHIYMLPSVISVAGNVFAGINASLKCPKSSSI